MLISFRLMFHRSIIAFISLLFIAVEINANPLTEKDIIDQTIEAIDNAATLKFDWKGYERIDGELKYTKISAKLQVSPFKVYIFNHEAPHKGAQVYFKEGENNGKAKINPGKFLPNVSMSPFAKRMRAEGHQTLYETGFQFIKRIIKKLCR